MSPNDHHASEILDCNSTPAEALTECLKTIQDLGNIWKKSAQADIDRMHNLSCGLSRIQDGYDCALSELEEAKRILTEGP